MISTLYYGDNLNIMCRFISEKTLDLHYMEEFSLGIS